MTASDHAPRQAVRFPLPGGGRPQMETGHWVSCGRKPSAVSGAVDRGLDRSRSYLRQHAVLEVESRPRAQELKIRPLLYFDLPVLPADTLRRHTALARQVPIPQNRDAAFLQLVSNNVNLLAAINPR